MVRLFLASFLSKENLVDIVRLTSDKPNDKVRWTKPEQLHLTWNFLGEVEESKIGPLSKRISEAFSNLNSDLGSVEIIYDQFQIWPNRKCPRLGVLLASETKETVSTISQSINGACREFSSAKGKKFRPHITIFRVKKKAKNLEEFPNIDEDLDPVIKQKVKTIDLVESDLSSGRPVYKILSSYKL